MERTAFGTCYPNSECDGSYQMSLNHETVNWSQSSYWIHRRTRVKSISYWFILWPINLKHITLNFKAHIYMYWLTHAQSLETRSMFPNKHVRCSACIPNIGSGNDMPVNPIRALWRVIYGLQRVSFSWLHFIFWRAVYVTCNCDHLSGQLSFILPLFGCHCAVYQRCLAADWEITLSLVRFLTGAACQSAVLKPP